MAIRSAVKERVTSCQPQHLCRSGRYALVEGAKATFPFGDADTDDRWEFTEEFGRRLGIEDYYPEDPKHPVHLWADHHAARPAMPSAKVFPDRRRHSSDGTAKTDRRSIDGHHKSAVIFAKRRLAANALTYHQHTMAPVIDTYLPRPGPYARRRARLAEIEQ